MEDEQDLSKVALQFPMFEALARGYLSSAGSFLTRAEKQHLAVAGKVIAFEQGIRSSPIIWPATPITKSIATATISTAAGLNSSWSSPSNNTKKQ